MTSNRPRDLGIRELALYDLYRNCQLGLSPQEFYARWNVTHAQMAEICKCSITTVDRWFTSSALQTLPNRHHLKQLAEMDLLWQHYEEIPETIRRLICPPPNNPID